MDWISVKDRLPDEEELVLILVKEIPHYGRYRGKVYYCVYVGWIVRGRWATIYCGGSQLVEDENKREPYCEHEVTHWMPLPAPPKETDK